MRGPKKDSAAVTSSQILDLCLLNAVLIVGMVSVFFIYRDTWFLLSAFVSLAAGNALAWFSSRGAWLWWVTLLAAYASYVVAGILVGSPNIYEGGVSIPRRLVAVVAGPITGWKELLTLELPLGTYQSTQAVAILVGIAASLTCFLVAWKAKRLWPLAAVCALLVLFFGISFGSTVVTPLSPGAPSWLSWQLVVGIVALLLSGIWASLRARVGYKNSLRASAEENAGGAKRQAAWVRFLSGGAMAVVAVAVAAVLSPLTLSAHTRDVLRSGVAPVAEVQNANTPLATYRSYFAEEDYDEALFTLSEATGVDRVRLATLRYYDGVNATVAPSEDISLVAESFVRVPADLHPDGDGLMRAQIALQAYDGPWLPMFGLLDSMSFEGPNREALGDGFFYDSGNATAIDTAEEAMKEGVAYSLRARKYLVPSSEISTFRPGNEPDRFGANHVPDALNHWISLQKLGNDGASLVELTSRLRNRGYLSHALLDPGKEGASWMSEIEGYVFMPSRSGHSMGRIGQMFETQIEREEELQEGADEGLFVTLIGDDEQFAVSAALIASKLGFNSRVVLGAVLNDQADTQGCAGGVCRGKDMRAWVEVQDGPTGKWAALDVTPQTEMLPNPEITQHSDPKNATEVLPKRSRVVPPPEPNPEEWDGETSSSEEGRANRAEIGAVIRWVAAGLLGVFVLASPIIAIVGVKSIRAKSRRTDPDLRSRVAGGWDEYVDRALDAGMPAPGKQTRLELAGTYSAGDANALYLARGADYAAFSSDAVTQSEADTYWNAVEAAKRSFRSGASTKKAIAARLSLRSVLLRKRA